MNNPSPPRPFIFLTGLPRSGTTWAAAALSVATNARLVHEPFNWLVYPSRQTYHMRYLPAGAYAPGFIHILNQALQPGITTRLQEQLSAVKKGQTLPRTSAAVLVKDVHVCLALPYLHEIFQPHTIILLRHPCGMAQSWHRLGLEVAFRMDLLLAQEPLREQWLAPFIPHLSRRNDEFFMLGAYWGAAYYLLDQIGAAYPGWVWVTHETLCRHPAGKFHTLAGQIGLGHLTTEGEASLSNFLTAHNRRRTVNEGAHSVARMTALEPDKWRRQLKPEQIAAVLAGAEPFQLLPRFFPTEEEAR